MQNRQSLINIKNALINEIAAALNVSSIVLEIVIEELNTDKTYSVTGNFKIGNFWSDDRIGKFTAKLDENLKIINLKIIENKTNKS
jgi:hypothetical protein